MPNFDQVDFGIEEADSLRKRITQELANRPNRIGLTDTDWEFILSLRDRNSKRPINQLPAEILGLIFKLYSCDAFKKLERDDDSNTSGDIAYWVHLTFVCSHWRNLALDTPHLWTVIDLSMSKWTEKLLDRSKTAALCVVLQKSQCRSERRPKTVTVVKTSFETCLQHKTRIKELLVSLGGDRLLPLMATPLPSLQKLELQLEAAYSSHQLPKTFLGGIAPQSLHSITLVNRCLPWSSPLISSNTILLSMICSPPEHGRSFGSLADMVSALRRAPRIEQLSLSWCPFPDPQTCADILDHAPLTHIKQLRLLYTTLHVAVSILRCLELPPTASLSVDTKYPSDVWRSSYKDLIPLIAPFLPRPTGAEICVSDRSGVEFCVWDENTSHPDPKILVKVVPPDFQNDAPHVVAEAIWQLVDFDRLEKLVIQGYLTMKQMKTFSGLAKVRDLCVDAVTVGLILRIHMDCIEDTSIPFPSLQSLTIEEYKPTQDDKKTIINVVDFRSQLGKPISNIVFKNGEYTMDLIDSLKQSVGTVSEVNSDWEENYDEDDEELQSD